MSYDFDNGFISGMQEATADIPKVWDTVSGQVNSSASGRFGGNCYRFTEVGGDGWIAQGVPAYTEFVMGAAVIFENIGATGPPTVFNAYEAGTQHLGLRWSLTDPIDLLVYRGTTLLTTIDWNLSRNQWYHIQLAGKVHDTTGYWYVYVNDGVSGLVASGVNVDTRNAGAGTADRIVLGYPNAVTGEPEMRMQDFYFAPVTSGPEHPGDLRIARNLPTGAGNTTQHTPSAGSNFQNVDDTTIDSDTTYNESATVGHKDTFAMGDVPSSATIYATKQMVYARKTDAGARSMRTVMRSGGTDFEGSDIALNDSYAMSQLMRKNDPATSTLWTPSGVNSMETGYKVQA